MVFKCILLYSYYHNYIFEMLYIFKVVFFIPVILFSVTLFFCHLYRDVFQDFISYN